MLREACERTGEILGLPPGYRVGIVPASDTGAFELAMWSLLGERPVDVFYWESFGKGWKTDIEQQLQLEQARYFEAPYGQLPDRSLRGPHRPGAGAGPVTRRCPACAAAGRCQCHPPKLV